MVAALNWPTSTFTEEITTRLEIGMSNLLVNHYYPDSGTLVKNNTSLVLPGSDSGGIPAY